MTVSVKYVGFREQYTDGAFGSGVVFRKGESKLIPADIAVRMLRHPSVYVPGDVEAEAAPVKEAKDDDEESNAQDLRDQIQAMEKDGLKGFAKVHFNVDLDSRKAVSSLREQVIGLVDQFGVGE